MATPNARFGIMEKARLNRKDERREDRSTGKNIDTKEECYISGNDGNDEARPLNLAVAVGQHVSSHLGTGENKDIPRVSPAPSDTGSIDVMDDHNSTQTSSGYSESGCSPVPVFDNEDWERFLRTIVKEKGPTRFSAADYNKAWETYTRINKLRFSPHRNNPSERSPADSSGGRSSRASGTSSPLFWDGNPLPPPMPDWLAASTSTSQSPTKSSDAPLNASPSSSSPSSSSTSPPSSSQPLHRVTPPSLPQGLHGMALPMPQGLQGMAPMPHGLHGLAPPIPPMPQGLHGVAPPPVPLGLHGISPPLTPTGRPGVTPATIPQGLLGLAPGLESQSVSDYASAAAAAANYAAAYAAAACKAGEPEPVEVDEDYAAAVAVIGGDAVPDHLKDARYFEKRVKSNHAAQKSREAAAAAANYAAANYAAAYAAAACKAGIPEQVEVDEGYEAAGAVIGRDAASPMSSPNLAASPTTTSPSMEMELTTSPSGVCRREAKKPISDHLKNLRYCEKRLKNNLVVTKSREAAAVAANYAAANYASAYAASAYKAGMIDPVEVDESYEAAAAAIIGGGAASPTSSPNLAASPTTSPSMEMELTTSPSGLRRRGVKNPVPNHLKDARYFEKRVKNNLAAKKSRDARRAREKSNELEKEKLEAEVAQLRAMVNQEHADNNALERILNSQGIPTPENFVPEVIRMFKAAGESADPAVAQQLVARAYKLMEVSGSQYRRQRQMLLQMHVSGQLLFPPMPGPDQHSRPSEEQRSQNDV